MLASLGAVACQQETATPMFGGQCKPGTFVMCICPRALTQGYIECGADRMTTPCSGCEDWNNTAGNRASQTAAGAALGGAGTMAAASGVGAPGAGVAGTGVAGPGVAGSGVAGTGAASAPASPPAALGCFTGEVCRTSSSGMKFCSRDPFAVIPPTCPAAGQSCGSNGKGTCTAAGTVGTQTALYCVYPAC